MNTAIYPGITGPYRLLPTLPLRMRQVYDVMRPLRIDITIHTPILRTAILTFPRDPTLPCSCFSSSQEGKNKKYDYDGDEGRLLFARIMH